MYIGLNYYTIKPFERLTLELVLLFLLVSAAWFWLDTISKREIAIHFGHEICKRMQLQLLDETVSCQKLRLARNGRGKIQIQRTYSFESTSNGSQRLQCSLILRGNLLNSWDIPPYIQAD